MSSNNKTFCDPCRFERKASEATVFCKTCLEYYCNKCKKQHLKFRLTMGHLLVNIKENWTRTVEESDGDYDIDQPQKHYGIAQKNNTTYKEICTYEADVLETEVSKRLNISGKFDLYIKTDGLTLINPHTHAPMFWPFTCIRRFGSLENKIFYFECGRRCWSGEGRFVMLIPDAPSVHKTISHLIRVLEKRLATYHP